jgi:hypothetical protein
VGADYQSHYLTSGRFVSFTIIVVCVLGAADIIRSGDTGADLAFLLVELAACLLAYVLGIRPAVHEEIDGVSVRNPLRTHHLSWHAVTNVDVTDVMRIHVGDTVVRCFAVPRRRPKPPRAERQMRDYGFPSAKPSDKGAGGSGHGPLISRADAVSMRLRERSEAFPAAQGQPAADRDVSSAWAADALVCLAAGLLLVVIALVV